MPSPRSTPSPTRSASATYAVPGPDGTLSQYAHASSIELVTTQGRLAQYYLGVEYSPKDILLGLIESSGNKIGSPVANILTYCYHYDPQVNKHSLIVARVVQFGGMVTMASLGGFMFVMFRRDLKLGNEYKSTTYAPAHGAHDSDSASRRQPANGSQSRGKSNGDKG